MLNDAKGRKEPSCALFLKGLVSQTSSLRNEKNGSLDHDGGGQVLGVVESSRFGIE